MDYLDQWNEEQRRAVAEWRRKNYALRQALAQITVRAGSRNGELGVTVDAHGKVTDLRLTPQALRLGEARLARVLLETIQRAQSDAQHQVEATSRPYVEDPDAAAAMAFLRETLGDQAKPGSRP
ncbi:YbaB/EbfC family nucleoid-associated protein [Nocardia amamiensis]|uniref:YbaB/EbfC family nucleoid-associated protein n=1 Tax=Nocardia amamiensis TaxID=404578 RepID=UPI0008345D2F|nr:YbaB/EbfC family nucleoid-associated protein [Nocardia amamiensis]